MVELYLKSGFSTEPDLLLRIGFVAPLILLFGWYYLAMLRSSSTFRVNSIWNRLRILTRLVALGIAFFLIWFSSSLTLALNGMVLLLFGTSLVIRELRPCGWFDRMLGISGCIKKISISDSQALKYSPDGNIIAVSGYTNKITLLNPTNGATVREISRTSKRGFANLAFSPDGKLLAGSSYDNTLKIWQTSDGALLRDLPIQITDSIYGNELKFSSDGQFLAVASFEVGAIIWRVSDMTIVREFPNAGANLAFSPDGSSLATFDKSDDHLQLWRISDWQLLSSPLKDKYVYKLMFSPDGKLIYILGGAITAWNVVEGTLKEIVSLDKERVVQNVAYSLDGKLVAATIWNQYTSARPDDNTMRVWNLTDGKEILQTPDFGWGYKAISFSPDNQTIAVQAPGGIGFWRVKS